MVSENVCVVSRNKDMGLKHGCIFRRGREMLRAFFEEVEKCKVYFVIVQLIMSCFWVSMFLGNAFSATFVSKRAGRNELPARTLEVLNLPNCPTDLISVRSETKQFAPVTMFCERGGYSGHVYQLLVNHRMMRFCNFTETHVVGDRPPNPPLINSMIHPTPKCSFSVGNFISLYAYEIVESDDEMLPRIYSPASLSLMNEDANVNLLSTSTIKGYRARPISVDGWLRVLDVFGFDRNPHFPQDHVSANEIASFLEKLGTYDLSSIEGLANFVRDCHMQWLYDVTEDPLPDQLNSFFSLVRGVMPMRLAAYDGRHRFSLCCYFSTGYFRPTPDVVMLRKSFDDMDFQVYEDDEPSFKRCAVFHPQVFILSQAEPALQQPMLDLKIVMKNLYKSGAHTTANQNLSVEASWSTVIPEFIEYLRMGQVESQLRTYDFDTFWEPPSNLGPLKDPSGREPNTVSKNTEALFTAFREFVDLAKETREALVIGDSKQQLSAVFTTLDPANKNKVYTLDMGKAREPKPPPGVPRDLGTFLSILKLCSDDMESIVRLRDLMELRPSRFKQVEWKEDAKSYFRSMTFLRYWVWGTSNLVTQHLVQRYIVDKAVIKYLLEAKGDAGLTSDLASIDIEPLTYPMAEAGGLFKNIKVTLAAGKKNSRKVGDDCGVWVDPDFQLPRYSSKLTQKLTFACQAVIFRDIVKAIVEYGQNPKFELNGNCNHMLHLYIRYVNAPCIFRSGRDLPPHELLEITTICWMCTSGMLTQSAFFDQVENFLLTNFLFHAVDLTFSKKISKVSLMSQEPANLFIGMRCLHSWSCIRNMFLVLFHWIKWQSWV